MPPLFMMIGKAKAERGFRRFNKVSKNIIEIVINTRSFGVFKERRRYKATPT